MYSVLIKHRKSSHLTDSKLKWQIFTDDRCIKLWASVSERCSFILPQAHKMSSRIFLITVWSQTFSLPNFDFGSMLSWAFDRLRRACQTSARLWIFFEEAQGMTKEKETHQMLTNRKQPVFFFLTVFGHLRQCSYNSVSKCLLRRTSVQ